MKSIFTEGEEQGIPEILAAKDKRVLMQQAIFKKYPKNVIIDVKMNIPGPIKNNHYLERLFNKGIDELEAEFEQAQLEVKKVATWDEDSGSEVFYVSARDADRIKKVAVKFEDESKLGRLFDADVLIKEQAMALSRKDYGLPSRHCFLCNRPAKECARSRRHSVTELQGYISKIYWEEIR